MSDSSAAIAFRKGVKAILNSNLSAGYIASVLAYEAEEKLKSCAPSVRADLMSLISALRSFAPKI